MLWKRLVFPVINTLLLKQRMVLWSGVLDKENADRICTSITNLNTTSKNAIYLQFYSSGGDGNSMRSVMEAVRNSEAPVVGMADIMCFSAAFFVLQCCKERIAPPKPKFLFHG